MSADSPTERCEHCRGFGALYGGTACSLCCGTGRVPQGTLCHCLGCRVDREVPARLKRAFTFPICVPDLPRVPFRRKPCEVPVRGPAGRYRPTCLRRFGHRGSHSWVNPATGWGLPEKVAS